jgi:hypothetical protein
MATSLGLAGMAAAGGKVTGSVVYRLNGATTLLGSLNDGNGVAITASTSNASSNFKISVNGTQVDVNLGDTSDKTKNPPDQRRSGIRSRGRGVAHRRPLTTAGFTGITASVDGENNRLQIIDSTNAQNLSIIEGSDSTAADLGLQTTRYSGTMLFGSRVLAGMQTTMVKGLTGFATASHDGMVNFKLRNDAEFAAVDTRHGAGHAGGNRGGQQGRHQQSQTRHQGHGHRHHGPHDQRASFASRARSNRRTGRGGRPGHLDRPGGAGRRGRPAATCSVST